MAHAVWRTHRRPIRQRQRARTFSSQVRVVKLILQTTKEADLPLAIAGTGYGLIGILVIILLVVLIFYFVRRA
jgi:hypothetical protein